jgi:hypothetical protein
MIRGSNGEIGMKFYQINIGINKTAPITGALKIKIGLYIGIIQLVDI